MQGTRVDFRLCVIRESAWCAGNPGGRWCSRQRRMKWGTVCRFAGHVTECQAHAVGWRVGRDRAGSIKLCLHGGFHLDSCCGAAAPPGPRPAQGLLVVVPCWELGFGAGAEPRGGQTWGWPGVPRRLGLYLAADGTSRGRGRGERSQGETPQRAPESFSKTVYSSRFSCVVRLHFLQRIYLSTH